jgi:hypothetical protein
VQTAELNEHARWTIRQAADALAYVAYNYDGSKLEDLKPGIVESTGAAETALIAERNLRDLLASLAAPVQAEQAQAEPVSYMIRDKRESAHFLKDGAKWKPCSVEDYELRKEHTDIFEFRPAYLAAPALPAQAEQVEAVRAAYEKAAQICDQQALEPECPERAEYCADAIRALAKEAAIEAPSQWISVEDLLPEDNQTVAILYWPYDNHENPQVVGVAEHVDGGFYTHEGDLHHYPSHWANLPAAPSTTPSNDTSAQGDTGGEE